MKEAVVRFLVNFFAVLLLSLLLLGPTAFSATLLTFEKDQVLVVKGESSRFGDYLKIEKETKEVSQSQFNLTFVAFPGKEAFYRVILQLKNNSEHNKIVKISNLSTSRARVFFAQDENLLEGPMAIDLGFGKEASINLLVTPSQSEKNEVYTSSFTLEVE